VRTVGLAQVGTDPLGAAAALADFGDDGVGLFLVCPLVDQHLRACPCQSKSARATDAT
jgi:hypothetical protein